MGRVTLSYWWFWMVDLWLMTGDNKQQSEGIRYANYRGLYAATSRSTSKNQVSFNPLLKFRRLVGNHPCLLSQMIIDGSHIPCYHHWWVLFQQSIWCLQNDIHLSMVIPASHTNVIILTKKTIGFGVLHMNPYRILPAQWLAEKTPVSLFGCGVQTESPPSNQQQFKLWKVSSSKKRSLQYYSHLIFRINRSTVFDHWCRGEIIRSDP